LEDDWAETAPRTFLYGRLVIGQGYVIFVLYAALSGRMRKQLFLIKNILADTGTFSQFSVK